MYSSDYGHCENNILHSEQLFHTSLQLWTVLLHTNKKWRLEQYSDVIDHLRFKISATAWPTHQITWLVCAICTVWCTPKASQSTLQTICLNCEWFSSSILVSQYSITHLRGREYCWSAQTHNTYRCSYSTSVSCEAIFLSFPQVLGVNPVSHVTVVQLRSLRMPRRLHSWEQPARRPSSGLGITVLTTSHTALLYSSTGWTLRGSWWRWRKLET